MVLIDVSGVTTVTPSGVAGMLDLLRMVRARGGGLRLLGASAAFDRAHQVLALSHVTGLHFDRDEASQRVAVAASSP